MAESRKLIRVFLASPGDLADERKIAKAVVDDVNEIVANSLGYQIELVGWEDTLPGFGRPQFLINQDLERCEVFVGMMWRRWGTPPDTTGTYTSGFEEEFEISLKSRGIQKRPEIGLFLKQIADEYSNDPGDELKKVLKFRERVVGDKTLLFKEFLDGSDFEKKLRKFLARYVHRVRIAELGEIANLSQSPTVSGHSLLADQVARSNETSESAEGFAFLRRFVEKVSAHQGYDELKPVETARFRLFATLIGQQGNDDGALGAHDANLLFERRSLVNFGLNELAGLVNAGLDHFSNGNVPLWHWLAAIEVHSPGFLCVSTAYGPQDRRARALRAMRLVRQPLFIDDLFTREGYRSAWFSSDSSGEVRQAALGYLSEHGELCDLPAIRKELDANDNQTTKAAAEAAIRVSLRQSTEAGMRMLQELQPARVSGELLNELFSRSNGISTSALEGAVSQRDSTVRLKVIELLRKRKIAKPEVAEQLLGDTDIRVRFESLMWLVDGGRTFSDDEAKEILSARNSTNMRGLGGLGMFNLSNDIASECLEKYRVGRRYLLSDREILERAKTMILDRDELRVVLFDRRFKQYVEEIRSLVDDQYASHWSDVIQRLEATEAIVGEGMVKQAMDLALVVRKTATRRALTILARKGNGSELARIRQTIRSGFVEVVSEDIQYFHRHGNWDDVPIVLDWFKGSVRLLLPVYDDSKLALASETILTLARGRLWDLLAMEMPNDLLIRVVVDASQKSFAELRNTELLHLLNAKDDEVRKYVAIKCVRALPKTRIRRLLMDYTNLESRYYNVIHWLDLGASLERARALRAADSLIKGKGSE